MKKTLVWIIGTVVVVLIAILVSFMITKSTTTNTSNSDFSSTEPIQSMEGEYIVAGVGPEMSFQPEVAEDTLVMNRYIDNSVDHLFIDNSSQTLAPDDLLP
ncbi:MAG: hypothetical protein LBP53_04070 [Candidatus Peribacteria bacterium]|jgi:hypothetical protein|nr:hypothetical protein [Candidatus Peribacteria bacterium]